MMSVILLLLLSGYVAGQWGDWGNYFDNNYSNTCKRGIESYLDSSGLRYMRSSNTVNYFACYGSNNDGSPNTSIGGWFGIDNCSCAAIKNYNNCARPNVINCCQCYSVRVVPFGSLGFTYETDIYGNYFGFGGYPSYNCSDYFGTGPNLLTRIFQAFGNYFCQALVNVMWCSKKVTPQAERELAAKCPAYTIPRWPPN